MSFPPLLQGSSPELGLEVKTPCALALPSSLGLSCWLLPLLCAFAAHHVRVLAPHHGQEGNGGKAPVDLWASLCSLGLWCGPDTAAWTSCASSGVSLSAEGTDSFS